MLRRRIMLRLRPIRIIPSSKRKKYRKQSRRLIIILRNEFILHFIYIDLTIHYHRLWGGSSMTILTALTCLRVIT